MEKNCNLNIKISIIVPVYNVEKYLEKCLDSLINQTLKDIEIICIDDCSTDNSLEILKKYALKDNRIKIITLNENHGQGYARNRGIELATGKYIGFVDSDDYVDLDYFEKLYCRAQKYNSDIAVASILKHKKYYKKYNVKYNRVNVVGNIQNKIKLCSDKTNRFFYPVNKLCKTAVIKNNNIKFAEGQIYEDVIFAIKALYYSNSVVSVPNVKYHYVEHKNSTVKKILDNGKKEFDHINAYQELQKFCKEHKINLPERLNYYTKHWYNPYIKTCIGQYWSKKLLFGFIPMNKKEINYDYPVDLVYLWVDGNDPEWKQKKEYWQEQYDMEIDKQAIAEGRFIDNEELKFSLRSAEKYAPWLNKIYIVTDNQIPKWLDTTNPKIEVVFHKDFISEENLPLFNSSAIETYLPFVPNLSEHFLFANDDMLFNKYVTKDFFFTENDKVVARLKRNSLHKRAKTSMYSRILLNMQKTINMAYNISFLLAPHHNIDGYKKEDFINCLEHFKENVSITKINKFRTENDIQRSIVSYYMLANNSAILKVYSRVDKWLSVITRFSRFFKRKFSADSIVIPMNCENPYQKLKKYNPYLFCTNDAENITNTDRKKIRKFLEETFPEKSSFEKD